jgi:ribosomal protein S18 acetylase RimI-like enzyme
MVTDKIRVIVRPLRKTDLASALNLAGSLITPEEMASLNSGSPSAPCFVAEAEGRVVGFNLARVLHVGIPLSKICVIQGIVVHSDYRRLGIGEKLVEAVFGYCVKHSIEVVRTLVDENDNRLRQFVEHVGFRRSMVANYDRTVDST